MRSESSRAEIFSVAENHFCRPVDSLEHLDTDEANLDVARLSSCTLLGDFGAKPRLQLGCLFCGKPIAGRLRASFETDQGAQIGAVITDVSLRPSDHFLRFVLGAAAEAARNAGDFAFCDISHGGMMPWERSANKIMSSASYGQTVDAASLAYAAQMT
jgi:hypothetical protein